MKDEKNSPSWHRGFGMVRSAVASVLEFIADGGTRKEAKKTGLGLGPDQFTAAVGYCERSGLVYGDEVSAFGQAAVKSDPTLAKVSTQWLMHYFLASPHKKTMNYWAFLSSEFLGKSDLLSTSALGKEVISFVTERSGQILKDRTGETGATGFLSTYSQEEGLGSLGFLQHQGSGQYQVCSPKPLTASAFACILADYWSVAAPQGDATVELSALTRGLLAQVLHQSEAQLNALLAELAAPSVALVQRQRLYTPYTVTRHRLDVDTAYQRLYD